ncbi:MAG: gas vesicle protein [Candidatus Azambacteria bacterium]|nr:gas vesicle protein [Candidatus Azambacteria bacterium]
MIQSKTKKAKRSKKHNKSAEIKSIKKTLNQPQLNSEEFQRGEKIKNMATKDILEKAKKELADLTGFKSPSAIGFKKEGNELIATIEVIEKASIPDGMDVLGTYEVRVDDSGKIISYERTDLRKRVDTALNREA